MPRDKTIPIKFEGLEGKACDLKIEEPKQVIVQSL